MPPAAAMREALRDIKEHEMALIAAIHVALKRLLEQIDPKTLAARLEKRWLLDDLMPGARKARIWEVYELKHAEIARELEEDFQGTFGKAFAEAYEQYVRQR
jgi:type VI secretion system FHA domain protein